MRGTSWKEVTPSLIEQFEALKARAQGGEFPEFEIPGRIVIPGRSATLIRRKLVHLGLIVQTTQNPRWTADQDRELLAARESGAGVVVPEGRSEFAARSRVVSLIRKGKAKLKRPDLSAAVRDGARLTGEALAEFEAAIRSHGRTRPHEWFTWKFGTKRGAVHERKVALLGSANESDEARMPCVVSKLSRQKQLWQRAAGEAKREALSRRMRADRAAILASTDDARPQPRVCSECRADANGSWFADERFFKRKSVSEAGGKNKKFYLLNKCLFCFALARSRGEAADEKLDFMQSSNRFHLPPFAAALARAGPELSGPDPFKRLGRSAFDKAYGALTQERRDAIAWATLGAFRTAPRIRELCIWLEAEDFGGESDFRDELWQLDGYLQIPTHDARTLGVLLFRLFGLPEYIRALMYTPTTVVKDSNVPT